MQRGELSTISDGGQPTTLASARSFLAAGIEVVIADVLTPQTLQRYRDQLNGVLVVQLSVGYDEALRRAETRPVHLTWTEFAALHEEQRSLAGFDVRIDVDDDAVEVTVDRLEAIWSGAATT